ncbi:hypothetical protein DM785_02650 [Deinococcus actinosclerus]|nr:hypothetical protein DM785_02650 [Deinococcus actinosclerus]
MPVNVYDGTTAPALPSQQTGAKAYDLPLLAYQPDYLRDFLVGGFTIDASTVPLVNGKREAYAGDVFRRDDATKKFKLVSGTADDGTGFYVMLPHFRDCTTGDQSANGLLRSDHVNRDYLKRAIPAALVGARGPFQYHVASPIDTRG